MNKRTHTEHSRDGETVPNAAAEHVAAIHLVHRVVGVTRVVEGDKRKGAFHSNLVDATVATENVVQFVLTHIVGEISDKNSARHGGNALKTEKH